MKQPLITISTKAQASRCIIKTRYAQNNTQQLVWRDEVKLLSPSLMCQSVIIPLIQTFIVTLVVLRKEL